MSKEGFVFENVGIFFTFAEQIVEGQRAKRSARSVGGNIRLGNYVSRQYFSKGDWFGKAFASLNDLLVVWVLFVLMTIISIVAFVIELCVNSFKNRIVSSRILKELLCLCFFNAWHLFKFSSVMLYLFLLLCRRRLYQLIF